MSTKAKSVSAKRYLSKRLGPMTLGSFLRGMREGEEMSLTEFAAKLNLSRANLCDIEKGRKIPSPDRAARIARELDIPERVLIQLSLQDTLRASKLNYDVEVRKAS